jgi:ABC-type Fe3+/spermidine/putrescine transport system ATPase subunit
MLSVRDVAVTIDGVRVLDSLSLEVPDGQVVAVLGPSGSGKTTLLRAVAGLVDVEDGEISWNNESILSVPTHQRGFGLMFQGYALFPHLDVARNVGFGLQMAGVVGTTEDEVREALRWVGLEGFESRDIDSLSGGEKQRVAIARTLAPNPRLVMLDEPLGALDRNLRQRLVGDTRAILQERGVTAIVVTHDRDEAVALSDSLALMRDGRIVQTGRLHEILDSPANPWVTEFLT